MILSNLNSLLPCTPGAPYGLELAQKSISENLSCSGEFAFGCLVPFEVEFPVAAGGRASQEIKPNQRLVPVAMVAHLSGPDVRLESISRRDDRAAGLTGTGITTTRDPHNFDWYALQTPFNPFPPDIGPVDSSKGFTVHASNLTGVAAQMFQATFFGAIGGYAAINYLKDYHGLSDGLAGKLRSWLRESGIGEGTAKDG